MNHKDKNFGKTFILYVSFLLLARSCGFIKEMILAYKYGANAITDAYTVAVTIETTLFGGIGTAIYTSYIPVYHSLVHKDEKNIKLFNGSLITGIVLLSLAMVAVVSLFPQTIVSLFVAGFNERAIEITVEFTRIVAWSFPFIGVAYILQGYLQANNHVYLTAFMSFPISFVCIIGIIGSSQERLLLLPVSVLLSNIVLVIYFGIPAFMKGFRQSATLPWKNNDFRKMLVLTFPIFFGQMVMEINVIIDKNLASTLQEGTVTVLSRGYQTAAIIQSLIGASIATIMFPRFSEYVEKGENEKLKQMIKQAVTTVLYVIVPIVFTIFVLSEPIVGTLFGMGENKELSNYLTQTALKAYVIGMIPISVRVIVEKAFYAMKDTRTPVENSIIGIVVNIIFDFILIKYWEHVGLASASSISALVVTFMLIYRLYKKIGDFNIKSIGKNILEIGVASVIMGMCEEKIWAYLYSVVDCQNMLNRIVAVGIAGSIGIITYITVLILIRIIRTWKKREIEIR